MNEAGRLELVNLLNRFGNCDFTISTDGHDVLEQAGNGSYEVVTDDYAIHRLMEEVKPQTELIGAVFKFLVKECVNA